MYHIFTVFIIIMFKENLQQLLALFFSHANRVDFQESKTHLKGCIVKNHKLLLLFINKTLF